MIDDELLRETTARASRYLAGLANRAVAPSEEALAAVDQLGGALPEDGMADGAVIDLMDRLGAPATIASAGPRYFGFVTGGALPVTLAGNWLASVWDQNAFSTASSPLGAKLEAIALDWLVDALRLPAGTAGSLVTGATMANFTGLAAARHAVLADVGWDVEGQGLFGAPEVRVIVGDEVHASLLKALRLVGFGAERVARVPADGQGRMRADALPAILGPTILCLQAGNVNSGALDPAPNIIPRAKAAGAWVHVDGAFGLWARSSPATAALAEGYEAADSWAVDGHKWLNLPYDCGIALVARREALSGAMRVGAAYLPADAARDPFDYTPECSRRMRSLEVWAALKSLGRTGLADLVERCCAHARRMAEGLAAAGFEVLNEVALNQVMVSFGTPEETREVIAAVQADGTCWCGGTVWRGRTAMRISISSWATTAGDIDLALAAITRLAREVAGGG